MPRPLPAFRTPEHWRKRAEEARIVAEQMTDPDAKEAMMNVAASYDRLARVAQKVADDKP